MINYGSIKELRKASAEAFVRTAILIDNEPTADSPSPKSAPLAAKSAAYGAAPLAAAPAAEAVVDGLKDKASHLLWIQPVTNGFASRRITCGFYFPADNENGLVETALNAARHVDTTIVDWQLRPSDTGPAKELITRLIKDDEKAGGRLRLVIVYTGERGIDGECAQLLTHLQGQGVNNLVSDDEGRAIAGKNIRITFANKPRPIKPEQELTSSGVRPVPWENLPDFVLEQYSFLAQGLLQSFALKSIGAVREDTHHLLSIFDSSLDSAYLAQRAGSGSPTDAEEMMTALLTSELACTIQDRGITTEVLGPSGSIHAVTAREPCAELSVKYDDPDGTYEGVVSVPNQGKPQIKTTKEVLQKLVKIGLDNTKVDLSSDRIIKLKLQFFPDDQQGNASLSKFARMASFIREAASERRLTKDAIHLTGGVVVRSVNGVGDQAVETYLLCVQPGCDAVRLKENTAFPFCQLVSNDKQFDLILRIEGVDKPFKMKRLPRELIMKNFVPCTARKTVISVEREGKLGFVAADGVFCEFVAELRFPERQHFTTLLVGKFNRVALNGSEWLRLQNPKDG